MGRWGDREIGRSGDREIGRWRNQQLAPQDGAIFPLPTVRFPHLIIKFATGRTAPYSLLPAPRSLTPIMTNH